MLDLFAGLGGASRVMRERGWSVLTVDAAPAFGCDVTADVTTWTYAGPQVDLLWASPPCTAFARESMPWCRTGDRPSMACVLAVLRHVAEIRPACWLMENVRGSVPWIAPLLGRPGWISNPVYLWGRCPGLRLPAVRMGKERMSSAARAARAEIPRGVSEAVALAVEQGMAMSALTADAGRWREDQ
jgi:hypothetical protein